VLKGCSKSIEQHTLERGDGRRPRIGGGIEMVFSNPEAQRRNGEGRGRSGDINVQRLYAAGRIGGRTARLWRRFFCASSTQKSEDRHRLLQAWGVSGDIKGEQGDLDGDFQ